MPPVRARTPDVHAALDRQLSTATRLAAGPNGLLSKTEQAKAPAPLAEGAATLRAEGGSGTRVSADALAAHLAAQAKAAIDAQNQPKGVGRGVVSRAERDAAAAARPGLAPYIARAWAIAAGERADVDQVAEARVRQSADPSDHVALFADVNTAANHQAGPGRSTSWLVKVAEDGGKSSFVRGRNDLWIESFDVDAKSGAVTVTGEH